MSEGKKPDLIAYVVEEGKDSKSFWSRVGVAWQNKQEGYSLTLSALPVGGKLVLLPPKEDKK